MSMIKYPGYFEFFYALEFLKLVERELNLISMKNEVNADEFNKQVLGLLENPKWKDFKNYRTQCLTVDGPYDFEII